MAVVSKAHRMVLCVQPWILRFRLVEVPALSLKTNQKTEAEPQAVTGNIAFVHILWTWKLGLAGRHLYKSSYTWVKSMQVSGTSYKPSSRSQSGDWNPQSSDHLHTSGIFRSTYISTVDYFIFWWPVIDNKGDELCWTLSMILLILKDLLMSG